jgi:hypothetical protein
MSACIRQKADQGGGVGPIDNGSDCCRCVDDGVCSSKVRLPLYFAIKAAFSFHFFSTKRRLSR